MHDRRDVRRRVRSLAVDERRVLATQLLHERIFSDGDGARRPGAGPRAAAGAAPPGSCRGGRRPARGRARRACTGPRSRGRRASRADRATATSAGRTRTARRVGGDVRARRGRASPPGARDVPSATTPSLRYSSPKRAKSRAVAYDVRRPDERAGRRRSAAVAPAIPAGPNSRSRSSASIRRGRRRADRRRASPMIRADDVRRAAGVVPHRARAAGRGAAPRRTRPCRPVPDAEQHLEAVADRRRRRSPRRTSQPGAHLQQVEQRDRRLVGARPPGTGAGAVESSRPSATRMPTAAWVMLLAMLQRDQRRVGRDRSAGAEDVPAARRSARRRPRRVQDHQRQRDAVRRVGGEQPVGDARIDRRPSGTGPCSPIGAADRSAPCADLPSHWTPMRARPTPRRPTSRSSTTSHPGWSRGCTSSARRRSATGTPGRSDIDIVAVTAEPATDEDAGVCVTAHALLAERQPAARTSTARTSPGATWSSSRPPACTGRGCSTAHVHHDGECFEINPVTWYTLATLRARGPRPVARAAGHRPRHRGADPLRRRQPAQLLGGVAAQIRDALGTPGGEPPAPTSRVVHARAAAPAPHRVHRRRDVQARRRRARPGRRARRAPPGHRRRARGARHGRRGRRRPRLARRTAPT